MQGHRHILRDRRGFRLTTLNCGVHNSLENYMKTPNRKNAPNITDHYTRSKRKPKANISNNYTKYFK